jgi:hypothetical protein
MFLCRRTALHYASEQWHSETAMALGKVGADAHCKSNDGYVSRAASSFCGFATVCGRTVCPLGAGAVGVAALAVQGYRATQGQLGLGVILPPHSDGDGAGEGGRGCALQG